MSANRFPYGFSDKVRLKTWAEGKYGTVIGYGDTMILLKLNTGEEEAYYKNAQMAYNGEWELHAPTPEPFDAYLQFDPEGESNELYSFRIFTEQPKPVYRHTWRCRITPIERIEES